MMWYSGTFEEIYLQSLVKHSCCESLYNQFPPTSQVSSKILRRRSISPSESFNTATATPIATATAIAIADHRCSVPSPLLAIAVEQVAIVEQKLMPRRSVRSMMTSCTLLVEVVTGDTYLMFRTQPEADSINDGRLLEVFPATSGHSMLKWGNKLLLLGGHSKDTSDNMTVRFIDLESHVSGVMEATGKIPMGGETNPVSQMQGSTLNPISPVVDESINLDDEGNIQADNVANDQNEDRSVREENTQTDEGVGDIDDVDKVELKRKRQKTSIIWDEFVIMSLPDGKEKAECIH